MSMKLSLLITVNAHIYETVFYLHYFNISLQPHRIYGVGANILKGGDIPRVFAPRGRYFKLVCKSLNGKNLGISPPPLF
jgi:hypothetical protein